VKSEMLKVSMEKAGEGGVPGTCLR